MFKPKQETKYYIVDCQLYDKYCEQGPLSIIDELSKLKSYNSWDEAEHAAVNQMFGEDNLNFDAWSWAIIEVKRTVTNNSWLYLIAIIASAITAAILCLKMFYF